MKINQVDPERLCISEENERKGFDDPDSQWGHIATDDLTESVAKIGVIQPPLVRPFDSEYKDYEVVIGQRRTLAAQEVNNFDEFEDIGEIPVLVVDWDDGEALAASIVENVDAFQEEVGRLDRARAIDRLKELREWSDGEVAAHLSVSRDTVANWLEPIHPHWKRTAALIPQDSNSNEEENTSENGDTREVAPFSENRHEDDGPSIDVLKTVRRGSETPEESMEVLEAVEDEQLAGGDVREAKQRSSESGRSMTQTVEEVASEKKSTIRHEEVQITFSGDTATALNDAASKLGRSPEKHVRAVIEQNLVEEGWL